MEKKIFIREAHINDLPALCAIRYNDQPAIHRDRINKSDQHTFQYFVAERAEQIIGFGLLLLERPLDWNDSLNTFPILVDLFVTENYRSRGVGQALMQHMEAIAQQHGKSAVYLNVEPSTNPRAVNLYLRLGYVPLQQQPYYNVWQFADTDGVLHKGEEWVIDMRKSLVND